MGIHVIKKDPKGDIGTLCLRCLETSVDTDLFPLGKTDSPCKQTDHTESIANTCHFIISYSPSHCQGLWCVPGSECMCKLLQCRKGGLFMLHRGSCPQKYRLPTRGFAELHISVYGSESPVCFPHPFVWRHTISRALKHKIAWVCWTGVAHLSPLLKIWVSILVS